MALLARLSQGIYKFREFAKPGSIKQLTNKKLAPGEGSPLKQRVDVIIMTNMASE